MTPGDAAIFATLAAFATLPIFWVALAVSTIVLWAFVVYERGVLSTIATFVVAFLIAIKFQDLVVFFSNPLNVAGVVLVYGLAGVLWARFKWGMFLSKKFEAIVEARAEWLSSNKLTKEYLQIPPPAATSKEDLRAENASAELWEANETTKKLRKEYEETLRNYIRSMKSRLAGTPYTIPDASEYSTYDEFNQQVTPIVRKNKATIMMWISYWPLSAVWFIIADLVKEFGAYLYRLVGSYFQKVSDEKFQQL